VRIRSPVLTLLAVAVLAAALLVTNMIKAKPAQNQGGGGEYPGAPAVTSSAPASVTSAPSSAEASTGAATSPAESESSHTETPDSGFSPQATYTGWTAGHEASVAIAVKQKRALAYLCDGASVESWLLGTARNGSLALVSKTGSKLTGTRAGSAVSGSVEFAGRSLRFSAVLTAPPGGLYTATVARTKARLTWIVRADGGETGLSLTGGRAAPAPVLARGSRQVNVEGTPVEVLAVPGDWAGPS
jgi:hypothetical protein